MIESKSHTKKPIKRQKNDNTCCFNKLWRRLLYGAVLYLIKVFSQKYFDQGKKSKIDKKTKTNKENFWHITLWERGMYPDFTFDNGASIFFFFSLNYFESMNVCVIIFYILLLSLYIFGSFFFIFLWVTLNRWMFVSLLSFVCSFIIFLDLL